MVWNFNGPGFTIFQLDIVLLAVQHIANRRFDFLDVIGVRLQFVQMDKTFMVGLDRLLNHFPIAVPHLKGSAFQTNARKSVVFADKQIRIRYIIECQGVILPGSRFFDLKGLRILVNVVSGRSFYFFNNVTAGFQIRIIGVAVGSGDHVSNMRTVELGNRNSRAGKRETGLGIELQNVQHILLVIGEGHSVSVMLIGNLLYLRFRIQDIAVNS